MPVNPIVPTGSVTGRAAAAQPGDDGFQKATAAMRLLNTVSDLDREISVARDPQTHKFVVIVRDRSTGTLIDQYPPENVLKMMSQMNIQKASGEETE